MLAVPPSPYIKPRDSEYEDYDQAVASLTDVTGLVIKELQKGSIERVSVFKTVELRDPECFAGGGRCEIYKAKMRDKIVAIKLFRENFAIDEIQISERKDKLLKYFIRECGTWKSVDEHPNIVSFLGFVMHFEGSHLPAIVSDFYDLGDLHAYVCQKTIEVPENVRIRLLIDACSGLQYLHHHTRKVFHRDIRGSNIFVRTENGSLVAAIGDFGAAKLEDPDLFKINKTTMSTSLAWTPPEYISAGFINYSHPTEEGDIWSFGCTIFEILVGRDPWSSNENILAHLEASRHPQRRSSDKINDDIWDLLTWCWDTDPARRKPAWMIKEYLESYAETGSIL